MYISFGMHCVSIELVVQCTEMQWRSTFELCKVHAKGELWTVNGVQCRYCMHTGFNVLDSEEKLNYTRAAHANSLCYSSMRSPNTLARLHSFIHLHTVHSSCIRCAVQIPRNQEQKNEKSNCKWTASNKWKIFYSVKRNKIPHSGWLHYQFYCDTKALKNWTFEWGMGALRTA